MIRGCACCNPPSAYACDKCHADDEEDEEDE